MKKQFSQFLMELRGNRSLREMERITGISHTYWSTLEKGVDRRNGKPALPSLKTVKKLGATFPGLYNEMLEMIL